MSENDLPSTQWVLLSSSQPSSSGPSNGIVTPPPSTRSNHPDESIDIASQTSTTFSDSSTEGCNPPGESFQLQSFLDQPPSHDSVPAGRHGCLGQPPAVAAVAQDTVAARMAQMQAFLDGIDRRLRPASDNDTPHESTDNDTYDTPDGNDSDSRNHE